MHSVIHRATKPQWRVGAVCALIAAAISACSGPDQRSVCSASFAYVTVHAIDGAGQLVTDLAIRDSVRRTHRAFDEDEQSLAQFAPGTAVIFTDSNIGAVRETGDSVQVTGVAGGAGFSAGYVFGSDGCHVRKIAGPDTVVVSAP